jgi:hypothetical protein
MCEKTLFDTECGEDVNAYAAKMLEIFVLQCGMRVHALIPNIIQLVFNRLKVPVDYSGIGCLRAELLMVSFVCC